MTVPRNFRKMASGQVTELSLTADRLGRTHPPRFGRTHPSRFGRTHPAGLGSTHPDRLVTTRPAAAVVVPSPPGSRRHPQQGRRAADASTVPNTYKDVDPYI